MIYFGYFSFSTIHLELKRQICLFSPMVPLKIIPDLRPYHNGQNLYPFSDQNGSKTIPSGAVHTYIAYIGEYPQDRGGGGERVYGWAMLDRTDDALVSH